MLVSSRRLHGTFQTCYSPRFKSATTMFWLRIFNICIDFAIQLNLFCRTLKISKPGRLHFRFSARLLFSLHHVAPATYHGTRSSFLGTYCITHVFKSVATFTFLVLNRCYFNPLCIWFAIFLIFLSTEISQF